jgi:hypothetical protein
VPSYKCSCRRTVYRCKAFGSCGGHVWCFSMGIVVGVDDGTDRSTRLGGGIKGIILQPLLQSDFGGSETTLRTCVLLNGHLRTPGCNKQEQHHCTP